MKVYCTSKNTGPNVFTGSLYMLYLGTSIEDAEKAVGHFSIYKKEYKPREGLSNLHSALPAYMDWKMAQFFEADGWWCSIVEFDLEETQLLGKRGNA